MLTMLPLAAASDRAASAAAGAPMFVHLPADQAAHPSSKLEWWWLEGHITSSGGNKDIQLNRCHVRL